mgnify:CR=1 FL=1
MGTNSLLYGTYAMGYTGVLTAVGTAGAAGVGFGAPGRGCNSNNPGVARAGGAGTSGLIIVEEFY